MQHKTFLILSIFVLIIWGCSSVVRFSDKSTQNKEKPIVKPLPDKKTTPKFPDNEETKNIPPSYTDNKKHPIVEEAERWLGTPYKYGGMDKSGVDCSGLTYNVYLAIGKVLPRTAEQQYTYTQRISRDELDIGDLIFFTNRGRISHVGIYIGNNSMIHSSTSNGVIRQPLDSYIGLTIAGYGRP